MGAAALAGLLLPSADRAAPRARPDSREPGRAATTQAVQEATVSAHTSVAATPEGGAALRSIARKLLARTAPEQACRDLEAEIVASAPHEEPSALRVRLERLLLEHPELAPGAARAFLRLDDRERAFAVSRALAGCVASGDVRSALDEAATSGPPSRREAALLALPVDPAALALARGGLEDASAPPTVRAAAAFALARGLETLDAGDRVAVLARARVLAASEESDAHLRAEALHLIAEDAAPADGDLAARALACASPEVALAGARLALATGAEKTQVAAALAVHTDRACAAAANILTGGRNP